MNKDELNNILELHQKWLNNEDGGERANLRGANLEGVNLWGANLRVANLRDADLGDADLEGANLRGVNLWGANLRGANLEGVNLWGANLRGANLRGATGNLSNIKSIFIKTYPIVYTDAVLQIGCERHLISEWFEFDDNRIERMDSGALVFWAKWKDYIKTTIEMSPAEPTGHKESEND